MFSYPAGNYIKNGVSDDPVFNTSPQTMVIVGDSLGAAASSVNTDNTNPINAITKANPGRVTKASHGLVTGDKAFIWGVQGMTQVNEASYDITLVNSSGVTIGVDTTNFGTLVANGWNGGRMYRLNNAVYNNLAQGFISGINMLSGQRYKFEHRLNRGIGGSTAANLKARIAADVPLSLGATIVAIVIAANDLNAGRLAVDVMADVNDAIAYCNNVLNADVLLSTVGPWDSNTEAQKDQRDAFNVLVRNHTNPRVIKWDWYNEVTDLATRTWKPGLSADGGHPGPAAGFIASLKADQVLAARYGRRSFTLNAGNLLANPGLSGSAGSITGGITGVAPDAWTVETGTTNGTKTGAKNVSDKPVLSVNIPSGSTTGERISLRQYATAGLVIGQKYVAEMEVLVDSFSGSGIWYEMSLELRNQSQAWGTDYSKRNNDSLAVQEMISASGQRSLLLRTPAIEFLSGWTAFGPRFNAIFKCDTGNAQAQMTILNSQLYPVS